MTRLNLAPNIGDPDTIYDALVAMNEGLGEPDCVIVTSRLLFLLINHIGDVAAVLEAIGLARRHPTSRAD